LFVSQIIIREAAGETEMLRRLEMPKDIPFLEPTESATALAQELVEQLPLPE